MPATPPPPVRVDVWSDLVCPWCYIGLRRLRRVAAEAGVPVEVTHHAYQLDPGRASSEPTRHRLARAYGAANVDALFRHAEQAAATEGLRLHLADAVAANTWDGHRLAAAAHERGLQDAAVQRLMRGHFEEGLDLAEPQVLVRLASEAGLPADEAEAIVASDRGADAVEADLDAARQLGIRGVPFFVVGGKVSFSGAQPDAVFREAFRQAASAAPAASTGAATAEGP